MTADILGPVWLSMQLATVTVVVLLLIGTPLAWWLAWTRSRARPLVEALVALPLVLPPTVLGFYLLVLLGPAGAVGRFWVELTGTTLTFSFSGLVIASVIYSFPFIVQPLQTAFEGVGVVAARWVRCDDEAHLDEFAKKLVANVARDHAGQLVYLAPSTVSLALTQERWPKIQFFATRESSAAPP